MNRQRLTADLVRDASPRSKDYLILDSEMPGLMLRVATSGRKVFKIRSSFGGRRYDKVVGNAAVLPLARARKKAGEMLALIELGQGPVTRCPRGPTFGDAASQCLEGARWGALRPTTKAQYQYYLNEIIHPKLSARLLSELTTGELAKTFEQIIADHGPSAERRSRVVIGKILNFAVLHDMMPINTMKATERLSTPKESTRMPTLNELAILWATERRSDSIRDALRLCILTAARRSEIAGMKWSELDLENSLWEISTDRTKRKKKPYLIPLTEPAMTILRKRRKAAGDEDEVFGIRADSLTQAMRKATSKRGFSETFSPHDIRRTMTTTMADEMEMPEDVLIKMLNHTPPKGALKSYNHASHLKTKRRAADAWGSAVMAAIENAKAIG